MAETQVSAAVNDAAFELAKQGLLQLTPNTHAAYLETPIVSWVAEQPGHVYLNRRLVFRDDRGRVWIVPAGFQTDLASVPKAVPGILRIFMPGKLESAFAAILHDWLFYTGAVSRREADRLFWVALQVSAALARARRSKTRWFARVRNALEVAVDRVGNGLMWAGVRVGGRRAWKRHRKGQHHGG